MNASRSLELSSPIAESSPCHAGMVAVGPIPEGNVDGPRDGAVCPDGGKAPLFLPNAGGIGVVVAAVVKGRSVQGRRRRVVPHRQVVAVGPEGDRDVPPGGEPARLRRRDADPGACHRFSGRVEDLRDGLVEVADRYERGRRHPRERRAGRPHVRGCLRIEGNDRIHDGRTIGQEPRSVRGIELVPRSAVRNVVRRRRLGGPRRFSGALDVDPLCVAIEIQGADRSGHARAAGS
jgi:hypothetical protein